MTGPQRPHSVRFAMGLFRRLTALLPRVFRDRHGAQPVELMARLADEAYRRGGSPAVAWNVVVAVCDILRRLPAEYVRLGAVSGDVAFAVRSMRRSRLSTFVAVVTLTIAVGFNAAIFSIVDWVLLRPLPYRSPQQLVRVFSAGIAPVTPPADLTQREVARVTTEPRLRAVAAFSTTTRIVSANGIDPFHAVIARITGDLFATLGTAPRTGRAFSLEQISGGGAVALIGEATWRTKFFADPRIVGRVVRIDRQLTTIIGVVPASAGLPAGADVWRPLTSAERADDDREWITIGRLETAAPGGPSATDLLRDSTGAPSRRFWAEPLQSAQVRGIRASLEALWVSAGVVLLMACASVAALLSARAVDRAPEFTVRAAMGADRARLLQQLVTESLLLSAIGGGAGLLVGRWVLDALIAAAPAALPRASEIALDVRVAGAALAATSLVGLAVGVATARQAFRVDPQTAFAIRGARRAATRAYRVLVLMQMATAVALTVTAVLFGRTLRARIATDHGFDADHLIAVDLTMRGFAGDEHQTVRALIDAADTIPGVQGAAVALRQPQQLVSLRTTVRIEGAIDKATAVIRPVTRQYFHVAGIPLTAGRDFEASDTRGAPRVAVVNRRFVRDVLGAEQAIGVRMTTDVFDTPVRIVGVAEDVTPAGEPDRAAIYLTLDQISTGGGVLLVRTFGDPRAIVPLLAPRLRQAVPGLAFDRVHRVAESLEAGRSLVRFNTQLASGFAAMALLLALVTVYGLTAGQVVARSRELAIRVALGSSRLQVLWSVVAMSASALIAGAAAGVVCAAIAVRWASVRVEGLERPEPGVLITVTLALFAVGIEAALLGALRHLRTDPVSALRQI